MHEIPALLQNALARVPEAERISRDETYPEPAFVATHTTPGACMLALMRAMRPLGVSIRIEDDEAYKYAVKNSSYGYYSPGDHLIHLRCSGPITTKSIYTTTHELGHHTDPCLPSLTVFDTLFVSTDLREAEIVAEIVAAMVSQRLGLVDTIDWCPLYIAAYLRGSHSCDLIACAERAREAIWRIESALEGRLAA